MLLFVSRKQFFMSKNILAGIITFLFTSALSWLWNQFVTPINFSKETTIIFFGTFLLLTVIAFLSLKIRSQENILAELNRTNKRIKNENNILKEIAQIFHNINETYRNAIYELFGKNVSSTTKKELLTKETKTLEEICQLIGRIFNKVTSAECIVTVKLVCQCESGSGKKFAETYARNLATPERDNGIRNKYDIGNGENTAFDKAVERSPNGEPSNFLSNNLKIMRENEEYKNQRQDFLNHYQSTIVVPIRKVNKEKTGTENEFYTIGYLTVDSKSTDVFEKYHVYVLSALAYQMCIFFSFTRNEYSFEVLP